MTTPIAGRSTRSVPLIGTTNTGRIALEEVAPFQLGVTLTGPLEPGDAVTVRVKGTAVTAVAAPEDLFSGPGCAVLERLKAQLRKIEGTTVGSVATGTTQRPGVIFTVSESCAVPTHEPDFSLVEGAKRARETGSVIGRGVPDGALLDRCESLTQRDGAAVAEDVPSRRQLTVFFHDSRAALVVLTDRGAEGARDCRISLYLDGQLVSRRCPGVDVDTSGELNPSVATTYLDCLAHDYSGC